MEVLRSALRHGVEPEDIQHVLRNAMVMDRPRGPAVIHAMPMRAKYLALLPEGW